MPGKVCGKAASSMDPGCGRWSPGAIAGSRVAVATSRDRLADGRGGPTPRRDVGGAADIADTVNFVPGSRTVFRADRPEMSSARAAESASEPGENPGEESDLRRPIVWFIRVFRAAEPAAVRPHCRAPPETFNIPTTRRMWHPPCRSTAARANREPKGHPVGQVWRRTRTRHTGVAPGRSARITRGHIVAPRWEFRMRPWPFEGRHKSPASCVVCNGNGPRRGSSEQSCDGLCKIGYRPHRWEATCLAYP